MAIVEGISLVDGPKQYGIVCRNGKRFIRNYHRELKNGKGLSFWGMLKAKYEIAHDSLPIHFEELFIVT